MKVVKQILSAILLFISVFSFGQSTDSYTCLYFDSVSDTFDIESIKTDSNVNCLEIKNAFSAKTLENIFSKIPFKEEIIRINITNYPEKYIPATINEFKNLSCFSLSSAPGINFRKLFKQLQGFTKLSVLELDDNERADIPSNIKSLKSLKTLSVMNYDKVDAGKLFKNISRLPLLKSLTLASIGTIIIEKDAYFPKNLTTLDMSDNWMSILPDDISKATALTSLDISENNFKNAEQIVSCIKNLNLESLSVSCYDNKDSLLFLKSFPETDLKLSVYKDFKNSEAFKNSIQKRESIPFIENYYTNTVKPRIGYPEIERKIFTIQTQKNNTLLYRSGSVIKIPENAFVDSLGNTVKGEVTIYYSEYKDIFDILANGIPMSYDSAGQHYFFQTAGMFEIFAQKDNREVFLASGKKISLDFSTLDIDSAFNLYRLNDKEKNWTFKTPLQNDVKITDANTNPAYRLFSNLLKAKIDTLSFEERYDDLIYARTRKIPLDYYEGNQKINLPFFKLKKGSKYVKNRDIKKMPTFYMEIPDYSNYKELNAFRGFIWAYTGALDKKEFSKKYITRKKWTDTRITYLPDEHIFNIELKNPYEFTNFKAFPVRSSYTAETIKYEKIYTRIDNRYNKILKKVQLKFDSSINKSLAREQKKAWDLIYNYMSPEEKAMTKEEWMAYAIKRLRIEQDSIDNIQSIYANALRSFEIDGFGIWNCDKIYKIKNPMPLAAQFKDALDNKIVASSVVVIDEKNKTIITYPYYTEAQITLDMKSESAFFLVGINGKIAIVDKTSIKNTLAAPNTNGTFTFTAYEIDPMLLSTAELRKLMGF